MMNYFFSEIRDEPWWGLGITSNKFSHIKKSWVLLIYHEKNLQILKSSLEKQRTCEKKPNGKTFTIFFPPKFLKASIIGLG